MPPKQGGGTKETPFEAGGLHWLLRETSKVRSIRCDSAPGGRLDKTLRKVDDPVEVAKQALAERRQCSSSVAPTSAVAAWQLSEPELLPMPIASQPRQHELQSLGLQASAQPSAPSQPSASQPVSSQPAASQPAASQPALQVRQPEHEPGKLRLVSCLVVCALSRAVELSRAMQLSIRTAVRLPRVPLSLTDVDCVANC